MTSKPFTFDKASVKALGDELADAAEKIAAEHGITVTRKGGRYDPTTGTFKPNLEFAAADAGEREFARYAPLYDLAATDYGAVFASGGKSFKVIGVRPKATKRPILCEGVADGKQYAFPEADVVRLLDLARRRV